MQLYNGAINEFVDWKTGVNTFTGSNTTGGLSVSGGSIRSLLLDRLKNPFYLAADDSANLYRMFSSKDAWRLWSENPSDYSDLLLFTFSKPSDYKLDIIMNTSNRYIRYGDETNEGARIRFQWRIYNDSGDSSDNLMVTYTISNGATGASSSFTRWYSKTDPDPNFSIYNYLEAGNNVVTISAKGSSTGASNNISFSINMLRLDITSTFDFAGKFSQNTPFLIPFVFTRNNVDGTAKIRFVVDEGGVGKEFGRDVIKGGQTQINESLDVNPQLSAGTHSLQIWAEALYNDGTVSVYSNLLYYTFTVASSEVGTTGKFINVATSFDNGNYPFSSLTLTGTQYYPQNLDWGYYTDSLQTDTSVAVTWKLLTGLDDNNPLQLQTIQANTTERATRLSFVPTVYTDATTMYLAAYINNARIVAIPIYITRNSDLDDIYETGAYEVKMSAYGKTNDSSDKDVWKDTTGNITTTFTNIQWNPNSGWYENSFRTSGVDQYAIINALPFSNYRTATGKTIEIEFESEKVRDNDDVLIRIGNTSQARIEITPNKATLYSNSGTDVIHTNYKANEKIKLAFIINQDPTNADQKTVDSGLTYIVNNGVLERGAVSTGLSFDTSGSIKIGGSSSGVRIYNMRIYNKAISYDEAYNNYVYDSDNKVAIVTNNNILDPASKEISYDLCKNKIDTILISGNLSNILNQNSDKDASVTDVTIERTCPYDTSKNFKIVGAQIRKHGQSTLNYPITSMKFWLNKSKAGTVPIFEINNQENLNLAKNRYKMKNTSIPSNKFVLQANYADSSGVHNGGLQRLIQSTWFNARIDGEYKLRTIPLLFATGQTVTHNDSTINDVDGRIDGQNSAGKTWADYFPNNKFPYDIEVAPDSFPCVVFYYDTEGSKKRTFLGQYVFMEDKKSDFLYGERSIYRVSSDPFCLTVTHKDDDTKANKIWDNNNVLRIEVLGIDKPYTSYITTDGFNDKTAILDDNTGEIVGYQYGWESMYEMIYPDPDDIEEDDAKAGMDRFNPNSKYVQKATPFVNWYNWVVSTRGNQEKFLREAAAHLDLYKMAAYYIFAMRFALTDSMERNAQIKTYDGVHFHYEPWDMDIALGNKNDGGIAFEPPVNRDTKLPGSVTTYAFSGKSANESGEVVTSNWLWDALEAWPEWANTIVPAVANALYDAGLKYDVVSKMFDENYADTWCETIYNKSGHFKYVESAGGDLKRWLNWLQGARMSHRHWWLSTSMDYYDAKWFCGDYKNHRIYLAANVTQDSTKNIRIVPNGQTYMTTTIENKVVASSSVDPSNIYTYNMGIGLNTKQPFHVYGANYMLDIDMSDIAMGLDALDLTGTYSDVLGAPLRSLNIGTPITASGNGYTTILASGTCGVSVSSEGVNALENLDTLNIRGHMHFGSSTEFTFGIKQWMYDLNLSQLKNFYAMGSNLINFYSSRSGNDFDTIELPSSVTRIEMHNSTWNKIEFWDSSVGSNNVATLTKHTVPNNSSLNIPSTLTEVAMLGTTGSTVNSIKFIKEWLKSIVAERGVDALSEYRLEADKLNWSAQTVGNDNLLTYSELEMIGKLRNHENLKGYIVLKNEGVDLTSDQLTKIKNTFGDTVFTKNSAGLTVDHQRTYVQINIGGSVKIDPNTGEVSLTEGNSASLNATQFLLSEDTNTDYEWSVGPVQYINGNLVPGQYSAWPDASGGVKIQRGVDGVTYLTSTQSKGGTNYDIVVTCGAQGKVYSTIVHVIAASYPDDLFIDVKTDGMFSPRIVEGYVEYFTSGIKTSMFVNSKKDYSADIRYVSYKLTRLDDNASAEYISTSDVAPSFYDQYISFGKSQTTDGVSINVESALPDGEEFKYYTLTATVYYQSGRQQVVSNNILVGADDQVIVNVSSPMFAPIVSSWESEHESTFSENRLYKVDLLSIELSVSFDSVSATLLNLVTYNGGIIQKYLPNVQSLSMEDCTNLTSSVDMSGNVIDQTNFSYMKELKSLNINGCTGFTGTIDLTHNSKIESVTAENTKVNIPVSDNSKLRVYHLGTPTTVTLRNQSNLDYSNVSVTDSSNIDSIEIINAKNNKGYNIFAKLMNL